MSRHRLPPLAAPLLPVAALLAAGIAAGYHVGQHTAWWVAWAVVMLAAVLAVRRPALQTTLALLAALLTGALFGAYGIRRQTALLPNQPTSIEAVVASQPVPRERSVAIDLLLPAERLKLKAYFAPDTRSQALRPGDGLRLTVRLQPLDFESNGSFDYNAYLQRQGFSGRCYVAGEAWQPCAVSLRSASLVTRSRLWFLRQRSFLLDRLRTALPAHDTYALAAAMTLGDRSSLSRDTRDTFAQTGAAHALALSGLHLTIVYLLLSLLLVRRWLRHLLLPAVVVGLWAYAMLAGLPPSLVRAATMLTLYSLFSLGRPRSAPVGVLSFTAIVMLVASPVSLFDTGFQLSMLSMLGILLLMPLATAMLPAKLSQRHPVVKWLWGTLCVSVAAQVAVAPLVAYTFGRLPAYFLVTNVAVVPAVWVILTGTALLTVVPCAPVAWVVHQCVDMLSRVLTVIASWPAASLHVHLSALQTVGVYLVLLALYGATRLAIDLLPETLQERKRA